MTGQDLVNIIVNAGMLDKKLDTSGFGNRLNFEISVTKDEPDKKDITYIDYHIDLNEGEGWYEIWGIRHGKPFSSYD